MRRAAWLETAQGPRGPSGARSYIAPAACILAPSILESPATLLATPFPTGSRLPPPISMYLLPRPASSRSPQATAPRKPHRGRFPCVRRPYVPLIRVRPLPRPPAVTMSHKCMIACPVPLPSSLRLFDPDSAHLPLVPQTSQGLMYSRLRYGTAPACVSQYSLRSA
ncbi:hypothetical protein C8Q77DRAFT_248177 [Trametes polyzona]|nr:hypothetical protein C8Q77DRAFT_248177 [Trametes polyzona]